MTDEPDDRPTPAGGAAPGSRCVLMEKNISPYFITDPRGILALGALWLKRPYRRQ